MQKRIEKMAKQKWKGGALIAPVPPAMISCGSEEDGSSNIITVAWTGIINTPSIFLLCPSSLGELPFVIGIYYG